MQISHDSQNLFLQGPTGRLEAILWIPTRAGKPALAAVVCHPHPLFGGTMHNKVVYNAAKTMDALGIPVLRFNFRGTGLSGGVHDNGVGEREDVKVALDYLATTFPETPLLLAGFSFGSSVGLRVGCADSRVTDLIGLGIPVNSVDFSFLKDCAKAKLFVHGAKDEHGALGKVKSTLAGIGEDHKLVVVEDADHFFAGHLDQLNAAIMGWLTEKHPHLRTLNRITSLE